VATHEERVPTELIRDPSGALAMRLPRLHVVVLGGPDRGKTGVVDHGRMRVGTGADADLLLTDPTVSQEHCDLSLRGARVLVVDHDSSNGTFVDHVRVWRAEVPAGATLRLGQTTLQLQATTETVLVPVSERDRFGGLLGTSIRMRQVFGLLERLAETDATVLLEGESGTGKELAAEALHEHGRRADGPFVVFDAGAVARELVESTLFGHVRGAFTGAVQDHRGLFEEADGGTLFLDEIGELPLELQPKLLRALEKREVRPVGSQAARKVDVRIVAATNRSLEAEVNAGRFRGDLYWRLAVVRIELPPLRARPEDIPLLVRHFSEHLTPPGTVRPLPSERSLQALASQPWPGNVRELRNAVERAFSVMGAQAFGGQADPPTDRDVPATTLPYLEARDHALERFERGWLQAALARNGGNVTATAREMGVNRKRIQRMMRRLGLRESG
jgi:DNA-binding NtrC family response regulator